MLRLSRLNALFGVALFLAGCSGGSEEEGRIRVTPAQVIGVYELKLDKGTERLELKADGTYAQDTVSQTRPVHRTGQWRIENHFFDGGEVVLIGVAIESFGNSFRRKSSTEIRRFIDVCARAFRQSGTSPKRSRRLVLRTDTLVTSFCAVSVDETRRLHSEPDCG